jgi:nucleotide-binding universal stress UspA family protein
MKFKRMLCGVDFSEPSINAFESAVELARALRADLHIIHVIEADPAGADLSLEEKAINAMNLLAASAEALHDRRLTTEVTTGRAFVEILNRVRERDFDLVVLGAKGIKLPEEAVFGGTAERVMKEGPCSVLIVRA